MDGVGARRVKLLTSNMVGKSPPTLTQVVYQVGRRRSRASNSSGGRGRANRKPWPQSQPSRRTASSCSAVSMPSAAVVRSSASAMATTAVAIAGSGSSPASTVDERAVDLHDVDREAVQVAERRVAGAEVVDGEAHAERLQVLEGAEVELGVLEHHALGDLEHERVGGPVAAGEHVAHEVGEGRCGELAGGDVDREQEVAPVVGVGPRRRLTHRGLEHPGAERHDEPGALGPGDDLVGTDEPASGWFQRRSASAPPDVAGPQVDLGLVHEGELVALERVPQARDSAWSRSTTSVRISSSKTTNPPRPWRFAWYMAASALRRTVSAVASRPGVTVATPMLADKKTSWPSRLNGRREASSMVAVTWRAWATSARSSTTTNSSPPKRAKSVRDGSNERTRSANCLSRTSPDRWPRLSLIRLNASMSRNMAASPPTWRGRASSWFSSRGERHPVRQAGQQVVLGEVVEVRRDPFALDGQRRELAPSCIAGASWGPGPPTPR